MILAAILVCLSSLNAAAQVYSQWVQLENVDQMPVNAFIGGKDADGLELPLCRALNRGAWHPGKVFRKSCIITFAGKEIYVREGYQIYLGRVRWQPGPGTAAGNNTAIVAGEENEIPRYLCQAVFAQDGKYIGTYPGKVVDGKCNVGWASKEFLVDNYSVGFDATPLQADWFRNKIYRIVSVQSSRGIETGDAKRSDGAGLLQRSDNKSIGQQWQIAWAGAGYYQIRSFGSDVCLDAGSASSKANGPLKLAACASVNSQMWTFRNFDDPRQQIITSKSTGRVLHVDLARMDDGAAIWLWERNNGPFQRWRFETVVTPATFEFQCKQDVQGRVAWNYAGDMKWLPKNLDDLCNRTANPDATVYCFTQSMKKKDDWDAAVKSCKAK